MRKFKSIVLAAAAIGSILGPGAAFAADLPARTYSKAPVTVDIARVALDYRFGGPVVAKY
jgi:hypothetical protein